MDLWDFELDVDENTRDVKRAAILAAQLPRDARVHVEIDPRAQVTLADYFLRQIDYNQRVWMYAHAKESSRGDEPLPAMLPGEEKAREKAADKAALDSKYVAEQFGLSGLAVK